MVHKFLISRLIASSPIPHCSNPQFQLSFLRHNAFVYFNCFSSESQRDQRKDDNFTVSYLIASCGFSPETATRLSKKLQLKTPDKPNAVLGLLKSYGFSETQIAKFILKRPWVLLANAETTLLPKLKFFHSVGVSTTELPKIVLKNYNLLTRSLENCLIPRYKVLKSVVRNDEEAVRALKRGALSFIYCDVMSNLVPNIEVLRECGVHQASISYLVMFYPGSAFTKHSSFVEIVKLAKEMGFDPVKVSFASAIHVLINLDRAKFESRLEAYAKWGWSREMALSAFRKYPTFMSYTEERITKTMNFLVNDMGWLSEDIARCPAALAYDLENRIIPRCRIIKILKSKGLIKNHLSLASFMSISEEKFLKTFVTRFLGDVPCLWDVYQGLIDHQDVLYSLKDFTGYSSNL